SKSDPGDEIPRLDLSTPSVSRSGDVWLLGKHRLLCGDARHPDAYRQLLVGEAAQMVFTDPPYNVRIPGHVSTRRTGGHGNFSMAAGEMSPAEFINFLRESFLRLSENSVDGSIHFICMDWRHVKEVIAASESTFAELKNICVWNKTTGGMGSFYRS